MCRPNYTHGALIGEASGMLRDFVKPRNLGTVVTGDSGIYLERGPDTVRGPDIYFISAERRPAKELRDGYLEVAPELCVEIVSPKDRWTKIFKKVEQFLKLGVKLVWVIDPTRNVAHVHRPNGSLTVVGMDAALDGEDVLPGFSCRLADVLA